MTDWATPVMAAVLLSMGAAIMYFFVLPGDQNVSAISPDSPLNLRRRLSFALQRAGVFDQAPSLILIFLAVVTVLLGILLSMAIKFPWGFVIAPFVVLVSAHLYFMHRQKQWTGRAHDELIPFFNRISTSVSGDMPVARAYHQAVMESSTLRDVLEPSAVKISSGSPFASTLLETLEVLPLRMWSIFVRQVELYEEVGGDVGETIQGTVNQVNRMLQLQAEARADYAIQAKQQQIIILILIAGILGMIFLVPTGEDMFAALLSNAAGIAGLCLGISVISFGLWFLNKQLRDVERKLNF